MHLLLELLKKNKIFYSKATGHNLPVVYVGAKTGRDGVGGASMASEEFGIKTEKMRPTVQVGDPYMQKCLMEACLELMETDSIISIQDMGAAGLTCSSVEMADKGNLGMEINLDKVPKREKNMSSYELMLSESQERMLMIVHPNRVELAESIFKKWDLDFEVIGKTLKEDIFRIFMNGNIVSNIPLGALSSKSPEYDRKWVKTPKPRRLSKIPQIKVLECLKKIISSENYCSREALFSQYDHMVQGNTVVRPGGDAGVIGITNSQKCLSVTVDVTPRYCEVNPFEGAKQAVAESFRNIISTGGLPIGITDNLNFGNPEKPEIMGQFIESIKGISEASLKLKMPVVSGNVSLYNETAGNSIMPTPTIGAVGIIENIKDVIHIQIKEKETLFLVGNTSPHLGRTALLYDVFSIEEGDAPIVNLEEEFDTGMFILELNKRGIIEAAHDISDGGLIVAIFEMCAHSNIGAKIKDAEPNWYFSESQGRYIISVKGDNIKTLNETAREMRIDLEEVGFSGGETFIAGREHISLKSLKKLYFSGLNELLY